jgi:hypothetical protein
MIMSAIQIFLAPVFGATGTSRSHLRALRGEVGEEQMFATILGGRVHVRLSRSNLSQLHAILDQPDTRSRCLARRVENGVSLVVHVEDDADHYEGRDHDVRSGKG